MNKCMFIGRVTKDIELRTTQSGIFTCSFSVAVDGQKNKDGVRSAEFPQIVAWRQTAELCARYLHKGDRVSIESHVKTRNYEKDGRKVYRTEFEVERVEFLTPKGQSAAPAEPQLTGDVTEDGFAEVADDSELPFE